MDREEAKKWAELLTAYAEGKTIEYAMFCGNGKVDWIEMTSLETMHCIEHYRIKPTPKTRRMTNQELADWLRDEPQEHREVKSNSFWVYQDYCYDEAQANNECLDVILVRRNHGEWEEPLVEIND